MMGWEMNQEGTMGGLFHFPRRESVEFIFVTNGFTSGIKRVHCRPRKGDDHEFQASSFYHRLPHMRRQLSGVLMHISSVAGRVVLPSVGFYCASKFALEALAESYRYELAGQGIESVIVEPGQYETSIFGNNLAGSDEARANTYGAVKEIPAKINAALSSTAGNAQEVADTVLRIVETPAGEKQLRYVVSPQSIGVDEINALTKQVQANILEAFGLAADTKFRKGKAAGSA